MNIEKDAKHDNIEQSEYRMLGPLSFWTVGSLVFGIGLIYPFALQSEPFSVILGIYLLVMAMYDIPRRFARIRVNESGVTVRYMFWEEFFPYFRIARVSTLV